MEQQQNTQLEVALDNNKYSDEQLISIKQPTNLPYYNNSPDFQRIDGEIEIKGVHYKYVKVRVYNDSLELLCIPNRGKMEIQAAKADFSRLASDVQQTNDAKKKSASDTKSFQKTLGDYEAVSFAESPIPGIVPVSLLPLTNSTFVNELFLKTPEHPPDSFFFLS